MEVATAHGAGDGENPKQLVHSRTRPYKIQREFEQLGIGADYLHENGLGLFHLSVLGRLMSVCFISLHRCKLPLMLSFVVFQGCIPV